MASFARTYSDHDLQVILQAVVDAEGCQHALTQAEYDKARETHDYAHTPRAKYIAKRLGQSWKSLSSKAHHKQASSRQIAGSHEHNNPARRHPSEIISQAATRHALQLISKRLGQDTLNAMQYERERKLVINEATDPEEAYALDEALPSAERLQRVYKTWSAVCQAGGLIVSPTKTAGSGRQTNPGSYNLDACWQAMMEALAWAAEENLDLTQRAYQQFSAGREGTPSLRAMQDVLKAAEAGSFAQFRGQVQSKRLKDKV